jgi:hypothetical protein
MAELDTQWLILESLWLLAALVVILVGWRLAKAARWLVVLLSLSIVSHALIFNNPAFFHLSNRMLSTVEIGGRQKNALQNEALRFTRSHGHLAYLFVGSSQVAAVFQPYVKEQKDCGYFSL